MELVKDFKVGLDEKKWFDNLNGVLYRQILLFGKEVMKEHYEVISVRVGLFEAFFRRKIKKIVKKRKQFYSRFLNLEEIRSSYYFHKGDEAVWRFLFGKTLEEISDEKDKFGGKKFDEDNYSKYMVDDPYNMRTSINSAIDKAKKVLGELNDLFADKNIELSQLIGITISIISVLIASGSFLVSLFL